MDTRLVQKLLSELQKSKQALDKKKKELEETEFISSSGGGLCEIAMNGKYEVLRCVLDDKVIGDKDTIQDLVVASMNEVLNKINEEMDKLQKEMKGLLPTGLF